MQVYITTILGLLYLRQNLSDGVKLLDSILRKWDYFIAEFLSGKLVEYTNDAWYYFEVKGLFDVDLFKVFKPSGLGGSCSRRSIKFEAEKFDCGWFKEYIEGVYFDNKKVDYELIDGVLSVNRDLVIKVFNVDLIVSNSTCTRQVKSSSESLNSVSLYTENTTVYVQSSVKVTVNSTLPFMLEFNGNCILIINNLKYSSKTPLINPSDASTEVTLIPLETGQMHLTLKSQRKFTLDLSVINPFEVKLEKYEVEFKESKSIDLSSLLGVTHDIYYGYVVISNPHKHEISLGVDSAELLYHSEIPNTSEFGIYFRLKVASEINNQRLIFKYSSHFYSYPLLKKDLSITNHRLSYLIQNNSSFSKKVKVSINSGGFVAVGGWKVLSCEMLPFEMLRVDVKGVGCKGKVRVPCVTVDEIDKESKDGKEVKEGKESGSREGLNRSIGGGEGQGEYIYVE